MLAELIATEGVEEVHQQGGSIGVMAIHGGLEEGTVRIATEIASLTGAGLYAVVQPKDMWWHVPSIKYDPADSAALSQFIGSIASVVSLHGYGEPGLERTALLGGNNRQFARRIAIELAARDIDSIDDLSRIPKRLRGIHRSNPVNLPVAAGVQVELPMSLRREDIGSAVVEAVAAAIGAEMASAQLPLQG